jgi:hypothetical protein
LVSSGCWLASWVTGSNALTSSRRCTGLRMCLTPLSSC